MACTSLFRFFAFSLIQMSKPSKGSMVGDLPDISPTIHSNPTQGKLTSSCGADLATTQLTLVNTPLLTIARFSTRSCLPPSRNFTPRRATPVFSLAK